ncbi:hypothetical protein NP233_g11030 [Leucocoprinus birnbaumii]|uniref:Phosphatidate phosphatase APP1 catalytic domain-containing protein n=1 Tax=Leucocoprinus birnbaumii TaxID=56174 RepID=A0AAD5VHL9_9AGAR|nr:hypothetical protein NP233_g11030 [Leucocoprinus birnbaumii]
MSRVDMPPSSSSWRHISSASSKLSSLKGLINHSVSSTNVGASISRAANAVGATNERRQTWRAWATQKIRGRNTPGNPSDEILTLFPGWAARRYAVNGEGTAASKSGELVPFEVDVFVSGYAVSRRSRDQATRSQRAFLRLAKGFAALPRIVDQQSPNESVSTGESLDQVNIPQVSDEFRALDQQFQTLGYDDSGSEIDSEIDSSPTTSHSHSFSSPTLPPSHLDTPADILQKLHYNLESRLQLFWSSTLPSRTVRLHLFASPRDSTDSSSTNDIDAFEHEPLATQDVETGVDGSFSAKFHINWDVLRQNPASLHIAFCESFQEHDLSIVAELLPPQVNSSGTTSSASTSALASPPTPPSPSLASSSLPENRPQHLHPYTPSSSNHHRHPHLHSLFTSLPALTVPSASHSFPSFPSLARFLTAAQATHTRITVPITHCPIRVISDIDDTVKNSGVTEGARTVFHNVFVKELKDGVIPGMGEWYTSMWKKGARFHYVSNGPYEYLSLLYEFFKISKLPPGSIKLKSYAGRSLFSGLLSTPAARKRAGVIDILDSLPGSKFILIGDSGEQDLELYADLAKERPDQILAIFIRDAEETLYDPIDDPTGLSFAGGNTGALTAASSPNLTPVRDEPMTPRFRKAAKRAFSDTFTSMRASVSRSPDGLLQEASGEDEFADTPKPQHPPTLTLSPQIPHTTPSSSPSTPSSLTSSSSTSSNPPTILTPASGYITAPPAPVTPLSIPNSTSTSYFASSSSAGPRMPETNSPNPSQLNKSHLQRRISLNSRSRLSKPAPPSHADTLPPTTPSTYYKPDSRLALSLPVNINKRHGSPGIGYGGMNGGTIAEGGSSGSSWSSSGSSVGGGGGGVSNARVIEGEKKRQDLQMRVMRARMQLLGTNVKLRVFRNPSECKEDVDFLLPGRA